jgi:hypothetical protein
MCCGGIGIVGVGVQIRVKTGSRSEVGWFGLDKTLPQESNSVGMILRVS